MKPFSVVRIGPKGPDSAEHMFCVQARSNEELIRTYKAGFSAWITGASGANPSMARTAAQKLADALNEQWDKYMNGDFHV